MRNGKVKTTQAVIDNAITDAYNSGYQAGVKDGMSSSWIGLSAILRQQPDKQIVLSLADIQAGRGTIRVWEDEGNRYYQLKEG